MSQDDQRAAVGRRPPTRDAVRRLARSALAGAQGTGWSDGGDGGTRSGRNRAAGPVEPEVRPADEAGFTWWVGSRQVLRLAPDQDATTRLRREVRLRDLVRPYVEVPLPVSVAAGSWTGALSYTLDTRLPGGAAADRTVSAAGESDLAQLLTGLGKVPMGRAAALGLPVLRPRSLRGVRAEAERAARQLGGTGRFGAGRFAPLGAAALEQLTPRPHGVVVHHDLAGPHLRVTDDGRVCGVLGWAAAAIGDPAEDIAGLAISLGAPIAVRAATLAGYGARECLRGLWLARCDVVIRLAAWQRPGPGVQTGWPAAGGGPGEGVTVRSEAAGAELRAACQRAWEPILLERLTGEETGQW
ncbi:phosphotransferase [Streptomyces odontomachi]|uniref:phosphotransferase n=1 Tax=Streptomyces odontomachi TaxID=2944940 RepID=UPI00210D127B|nr:phosphotransferase [Streptomyces sp. ODS25]